MLLVEEEVGVKQGDFFYFGVEPVLGMKYTKDRPSKTLMDMLMSHLPRVDQWRRYLDQRLHMDQDLVHLHDRKELRFFPSQVFKNVLLSFKGVKSAGNDFFEWKLKSPAGGGTSTTLLQCKVDAGNDIYQFVKDNCGCIPVAFAPSPLGAVLSHNATPIYQVTFVPSPSVGDTWTHKKTAPRVLVGPRPPYPEFYPGCFTAVSRTTPPESFATHGDTQANKVEIVEGYDPNYRPFVLAEEVRYHCHTQGNQDIAPSAARTNVILRGDVFYFFSFKGRIPKAGGGIAEGLPEYNQGPCSFVSPGAPAPQDFIFTSLSRHPNPPKTDDKDEVSVVYHPDTGMPVLRIVVGLWKPAAEESVRLALQDFVDAFYTQQEMTGFLSSTTIKVAEGVLGTAKCPVVTHLIRVELEMVTLYRRQKAFTILVPRGPVLFWEPSKGEVIEVADLFSEAKENRDVWQEIISGASPPRKWRLDGGDGRRRRLTTLPSTSFGNMSVTEDRKEVNAALSELVVRFHHAQFRHPYLAPPGLDPPPAPRGQQIFGDIKRTFDAISGHMGVADGKGATELLVYADDPDADAEDAGYWLGVKRSGETLGMWVVFGEERLQVSYTLSRGSEEEEQVFPLDGPRPPKKTVSLERRWVRDIFTRAAALEQRLADRPSFGERDAAVFYPLRDTWTAWEAPLEATLLVGGSYKGGAYTLTNTDVLVPFKSLSGPDAAKDFKPVIDSAFEDYQRRMRLEWRLWVLFLNARRRKISPKNEVVWRLEDVDMTDPMGQVRLRAAFPSLDPEESLFECFLAGAQLKERGREYDLRRHSPLKTGNDPVDGDLPWHPLRPLLPQKTVDVLDGLTGGVYLFYGNGEEGAFVLSRSTGVADTPPLALVMDERTQRVGILFPRGTKLADGHKISLGGSLHPHIRVNKKTTRLPGFRIYTGKNIAGDPIANIYTQLGNLAESMHAFEGEGRIKIDNDNALMFRHPLLHGITPPERNWYRWEKNRPLSGPHYHLPGKEIKPTETALGNIIKDGGNKKKGQPTAATLPKKNPARGCGMQ